MNISRILKMAVDGDYSSDALRYLISCHAECEHLDFKVEINFSNDHTAVGITKDIIGMKNIGGGYLVFGVSDKNWNPIGIPNNTGYDTKLLRDMVRKYSGLDIECDFIEHTIEMSGSNKIFALILIRSSLKRNKLKKPSTCKISYKETEKWGIRKGDTYIRDGDQTTRLVDFEKLIEKLQDLEDKYQEAEQLEATSIPSPFAVETGFYRLLPKEYATFVGRENLLEKIKSAIEKDPRIWIINLYGPGGVGKSALATNVAYDYYQSRSFEAILQLSAKDRELQPGKGISSLRPSLISIEDLIDRILHLFSHQECCDDNFQKKKDLANELLSAFSTLIILDNMETVTDGRIMEFVRTFPPTTKSKVLLTSRQRNSDWEMPIQVTELSNEEIMQFVKSRSIEMNLNFPFDNNEIIKKISEISGGLPLAIQWILGDYSRTNNLESILRRVITNDSPLLEFSFRNSWNTLDKISQEALAVLSIFDEAPTLQEWRTVLNWTVELIERSKSKLIESTFVTERTDQKTGNKIYIALPITLSFAKLQLNQMGTLEKEARSRYENYHQQISLSHEQEYQVESLFSRFDATNEIQRKAIILTQMAEGQMSSLGYQEAEEYYKQALSIDPFSIFALVSYGKFKADLFDFQAAEELILQAEAKVTKKTGFFVFYNLADVYGRKKDWSLKIKYLREAMKYKDYTTQFLYTMAQHSLGVALGKIGNHIEAIQNFDEIINRELSKPYGPSDSLVVATRTKKISLQRKNPKFDKKFIDEIIENCKKYKNIDHIINELYFIRDKE